jgi:cytochrome c556
MRLSIALAALALVGTAAQAQDHSKHQQKPKEPMKHEMGDMKHMAGPWKEMNAFHGQLAGAFHPAKEQKNLKPLRDKADALAAAARAWAASTPPAACSDPALKSTVAALSTDALAIGNQVLAYASDADLTTAITALHDKFETVEKKCGGHDMKGMKH